ncbi:MAG: cysteine--tRNA ligase [Bacteroidetes bacterium]|nr:MAG: cysteine--tRNA ligase [Bacteroidota bacterium]MBL1144887.1 cysteine--tRNA ligase [Bacteroidota bacterium]MCB0802429.1 cysteine--tRNA ligase [Flavobacteriales bacterium]NOG57681.1 cysteine--tRNA ligase [Bacteroidota bacterium]
MNSDLVLYNTLSREKEVFKPIDPNVIGMYVCGPTVYGDAHLGHAKSYVSFDLIYRYLKHKFPRVKYVQNITDVGHLTDDADAGDDKIAKQSRLEKVDPMAIVEKYMHNYFRDMDALNVERADIYPRPSGHIPEQIENIESLIEKGFAYVMNGSVYFDVAQYDKNHHYGKLSGRSIEEMLEGAANRSLSSQSEKKNGFDFALWKKADESHLMQWNSPWGKGYPGWHIECTVMSQKYLGENFDIHGGGLENQFPHHECEIAQAEANTGKAFANYWLHNNMVTINGQKMGKSLGNGIFCAELFSGDNFQLERAYSPMTVRFFILQSHYRSTLDFSNDALEAASKGFDRLSKGLARLEQLKPSSESSINVSDFEKGLYAAMNDDFNSPIAISKLFDGLKMIAALEKGEAKVSADDLKHLKTVYHTFFFDILGLKLELDDRQSNDITEHLMQLILDFRAAAKAEKNYASADKIRDKLKEINIVVKDGKDGAEWSYE